MATRYTSKYPTIVIDKSANSVNESMVQKITVEQYYDFMHHTHDISAMTVSEGNMSYDEMQTTINQLNQTLNGLNTTIEQQNEIIKKLEADTTEFKKLIAVQNEIINTIKADMENMASVSDWDVETPGDQDINGNTLGTLMGFTMTEIE
jgi:TolA-binding protein